MKQTTTAIIVTRGNLTDEDLLTVSAPLAAVFGDVLLWNNATRPFDLKLLGCYMAVGEAPSDLICYQDDDVVQSDPLAIAAAWEPGLIVCNMPQDFQAAYRGKPDALMGFGSVFHRDLVRPTWERYRNHFPIDAVACREAHRIFTGLNRSRVRMVDVPKTNMPYASDADRLWKQRDHGAMAAEAYRRVKLILEAER